MLSFKTAPARAEVEQRSLRYPKLPTSSCLHLATGTNTPYAQNCKRNKRNVFSKKELDMVRCSVYTGCLHGRSAINFSEWQNQHTTIVCFIYMTVNAQLFSKGCFICGINNKSWNDACLIFTKRKLIHKYMLSASKWRDIGICMDFRQIAD